jgi:hypothetical protein
MVMRDVSRSQNSGIRPNAGISYPTGIGIEIPARNQSSLGSVDSVDSKPSLEMLKLPYPLCSNRLHHGRKAQTGEQDGLTNTQEKLLHPKSCDINASGLELSRRCDIETSFERPPHPELR